MDKNDGLTDCTGAPLQKGQTVEFARHRSDGLYECCTGGHDRTGGVVIALDDRNGSDWYGYATVQWGGAARPCRVPDTALRITAAKAPVADPAELQAFAIFLIGEWALHREPTPEEIARSVAAYIVGRQAVES